MLLISLYAQIFRMTPNLQFLTQKIKNSLMEGRHLYPIKKLEVQPHDF